MGSMIDTLLDDDPNDAKYIEGHRCGSIPSLLDTRPLNTQPPSLPDDFDKDEPRLKSEVRSLCLAVIESTSRRV
jgi:hypothetical protein